MHNSHLEAGKIGASAAGPPVCSVGEFGGINVGTTGVPIILTLRGTLFPRLGHGVFRNILGDHHG